MGCGSSSTKEESKDNAHNTKNSSYNSVKKKKSKISEIAIKEINYSALRVTKFYKNQTPYKGSTQYKDDIFPPDDNSIFGLDKKGKPTDPDYVRRKGYLDGFGFRKGDIIWKTAKEIFGEKYSIFEGDISLTDVNQGGIGNCYLLATLAAMCELPQLIASIFRTLTVPNNGYYELVFRVNGTWQIIIMDEYFPCDKNTGKPIFASPKGPELWVMLLEKAWAKVNGGYLNTIIGYPAEIMIPMTNFPFEYLDFANMDKDILWEKLIKASNTDYIMACNISDDSEIQRRALEVSLVPGHVYTLVNAFEKSVKGENIKLVNIRNPWGTSNYNGPFSDFDEIWNDEEYVKAFNFTPQTHKGSFWIKYEDLPYYFCVGQVCLIESPVATQIFEIPVDRIDKSNIYEFKVKEQGTKVTIQIARPNYRYTRDLPSEYNLPLHCVIVKKDSSKCEELIKEIKSGKKDFKGEELFSSFYGSCKYDENLMTTLELDKGDYLVYTLINYKNAVPKIKSPEPCVISISADQLFDFYDAGYVDDSSANCLMNILYLHLKNEPNYEEKEGVEFLYQTNVLGTELAVFICRNTTNTPKKIKLNANTDNYMSINFDIKKETIITLNKKGDEFIGISSTCDFYGNLELTYDYIVEDTKADLSSKNLQLLRTPFNPEMLKTLTEKVDVIEEYEWVHKKLENFDYSMIFKKLDFSSDIEKKMIETYPQEMEKILKYPKLEDGVEVDFQDKNEIDDQEYLGEWELSPKTDDKPHGRGMIWLKNENIYIGQFQFGEMSGVGCLQYSNGERLECKFVKGKPTGNGILYKNDGRTEAVKN